MALVAVTCPYCRNQFQSDLLDAVAVDYPSSGSAYVVPSGGGTAMPTGTFSGKASMFRNLKCPHCGKVFGIDSDDL